MPAEAAIEYERCDRDAKRYAALFPRDAEIGSPMFGYLRSESRLRLRFLGDTAYQELLHLVRRHRQVSVRRERTGRVRATKRRRRS